MNWLDYILRLFMDRLYPTVSPLKPLYDLPEAPKLTYEPSIIPKPPPMTNAEKLYQKALESVGKDMSPQDKALDYLACMESIDGVWYATFGEHLLAPVDRLSTNRGYAAMLKDKRLKKIDTPQKGAIVISPTGYSTKGSSHGHTGICGNFDVMSNDSNTGNWTINYTKDAWLKVFGTTLGFPTYYFLPIDT